MNTDKEVVLAAIGAIVIIESIALIKGINGTLLTIAVSAICLLAGKALPQFNFLKGGK